MKYRTMTISGSYGSDVEAYSDEEAITEAEKRGYEVLDVTELGGQLILVVGE